MYYVPSRGPAWSRPPRSSPPPERVVRSAPENWQPLLAAEPPASSSNMTPHATSAAIDRGSTATLPFLPCGCPGADAASPTACGVGIGGGERRIRSLMSMRRGARAESQGSSVLPALLPRCGLWKSTKESAVATWGVVSRHERRSSGADPRG